MSHIAFLHDDIPPPSLTETFSNYSIFFLLQNNGITINCSVYALTQGQLTYQDYFSEQWINETELFLPAFFATNCSVLQVLTQIRHENISELQVSEWMNKYLANPYNIQDNSDLFVALLFTFLGLCILAWMLMLLHLLLPRYKRKPWLTLLSTLVYAILLTFILAEITNTTREEYYKNSLNMVNIMSVFDKRRYPYLLNVLQFLIDLAYIQMLRSMVKNSWHLRSTVFAAFLSIASLALSLTYVYWARYLYGFANMMMDKSLVAAVSVSIVFIGWFSSCLLYHTLKAKPRLVSYTLRLLPLGLFTWVIIITREGLCILLIARWNKQWPLNAWLLYIPSIIDLCILTCSWEWLYLIQQVEQKLELSGMLGRRISISDVMNFSNDLDKGIKERQTHSVKDWAHQKWINLRLKKQKKTIETTTTTNNENQPDSDMEMIELQPTVTKGSTDGYVVNLDQASVCEVHHGGSDLWDNDSDSLDDERVSTTQANEESSDQLAIDIIVSGSVHTSTSSREFPPSFEPLPGQSINDYWDDKGH